MPVLSLDEVEVVPLQLVSRLIQDFSVSCIFYIIGVDLCCLCCLLCNRLLMFQVLSLGCHGLPAISAVSYLIHNFQQASGQQINRGKTALIPVSLLSHDERATCFVLWHSNILISSRERVIRVFIGIHVSIHDPYYNTVHKFDMAFSVLSRAQFSLSLAIRVLVVNIFMFTPNRNLPCRVFCCKRLRRQFCVS